MKTWGIAGEAATLVGGKVAAQGIALAAYFALTRLFSPDDYGLYNIFYSYIEVLIILSTCKYELAAIVASDEREASAVERFALRLNTIVSLTLLTVALILWLTGALPGNFDQLGWMVLLIPPMVFFGGTSRIYSNLYNRFYRYTQIAISDNVGAGTGALTKIVFGLLGITSAGLPLGAVLGQAATNINYRLHLGRLGLPDTTKAESKAAAHKHFNFPLYVATKDFMNTFSANLPFLWASAYFDRAEIGLFGLALTFTMQPVSLLSSAFERVLYARTAEAVRERRSIAHTISRFCLLLAVTAMAACVLAWFFAEPIFTFCFGERWQGSGIYVRSLLPWAFIGLCSTSLMFVSNVFSTQRIELYFNIAMLLLRAAAIYTGIRMGSFLLAIRMYALASAITHAALTAWYLWQTLRYERSLKV
ncbi:MAG: oligosaccharide flippase family protein [Bacteroidales bacterium]|nr:oligosaccharide flippase family protein [Bacteroidales bacterium]